MTSLDDDAVSACAWSPNVPTRGTTASPPLRGTGVAGVQVGPPPTWVVPLLGSMLSVSGTKYRDAPHLLTALVGGLAMDSGLTSLGGIAVSSGTSHRNQAAAAAAAGAAAPTAPADAAPPTPSTPSAAAIARGRRTSGGLVWAPNSFAGCVPPSRQPTAHVRPAQTMRGCPRLLTHDPARSTCTLEFGPTEWEIAQQWYEAVSFSAASLALSVLHESQARAINGPAHLRVSCTSFGVTNLRAVRMACAVRITLVPVPSPRAPPC